ncbi:MAG: GyrI-like domain-containing protein [Chloroflexota bacterium]
MDAEVSIQEVAQQYLAAVREHTTSRTLAPTIRRLLNENAIYPFLKAAEIKEHSHNVFVFWDDEEKAADQGLTIEVAVQVFAPFTGNGRVICSSTPQGKAATLLHVGAYEELGRTHAAIIQWCRANEHPITGLRWEIYGRWNDDPNQRFTDVFYLLK